MNNVVLIGRLTKDPQIRYTSGSNTAVASFTIAIDRPSRQGEQKQADFPRIIVFGRQAESCEKYLEKGLRVGISGRIQTGSYQNRNGDTVYTTDVVANRVEFLEWKNQVPGNTNQVQNQVPQVPNQVPSYSQNPQAYYNSTYQNQPQNAQPSGPQQTMMQAPSPDPADEFEAIDEDVPF